MIRARQVPAASRRAVAIREEVAPGEATTIRCSYCPATAVATWPLNLNGSPSYWPLFGGFTLDHVLAVANGGSDDPENLVIACGPCNVAKLDRPVESFRGHSAVVAGSTTESIHASSEPRCIGNGMEGNGMEWNGMEKKTLIPIHRT